MQVLSLLFAVSLFLCGNSFLINDFYRTIVPTQLNKNNYNPFGRKYYQEIKKNNTSPDQKAYPDNWVQKERRSYPITNLKYIEQMKRLNRLNSKNRTIQDASILGIDLENDADYSANPDGFSADTNDDPEIDDETDQNPLIHIIVNQPKSGYLQSLGIQFEESDGGNPQNGYFDEDDETGRRRFFEKPSTKSKNFEVINKFSLLFKDIGGYENVKEELRQCIDILKNFHKYAKYNVRIPKGLILEGPPGTGKTMLAKALAGEAKCGFIPVSGADFQEKYVGVGPTRIKELFELAKKNVPCIIFIDEIDAVGRKRSSDGESSSNERDNTLNALLVELDGFKNNTGVFLVAATNRVDLLDSALTRPGRIDKNIFIGLPDTATREAIIKIHIHNKPHSANIEIDQLVDVTEGLSGAQIENLLNEGMLNALKDNRELFTMKDLDLVMNKMLAGWQPNEHEFTSDIIDRIAIHEMGHATAGLVSKHHSKVTKVVINLFSPKSPGYTVFEGSTSNIYIREALFEHLMILLAGRIAEELFYYVSVTTGAINDFEEALKLAEKMIVYYGMGSNVIYPNLSEKYKELIDIEVAELIGEAYRCCEIILRNSKEFIYETSEILKRDRLLKADQLNTLIDTKYSHLRL
jgi:cell division protease FtsH